MILRYLFRESFFHLYTFIFLILLSSIPHHAPVSFSITVIVSLPSKSGFPLLWKTFPVTVSSISIGRVRFWDISRSITADLLNLTILSGIPSSSLSVMYDSGSVTKPYFVLLTAGMLVLLYVSSTVLISIS